MKAKIKAKILETMKIKIIKKLIAIILFLYFKALPSQFSNIYEQNHQVNDEQILRKEGFDPNYIKEKYELTVFGKQCIFFPSQNPQKLIIIFGYRRKNVYALWSWFWRSDENWGETAYLFLKDDDLAWFVGTRTHQTIDVFANMINYFINKLNLSKKHVFTVGSSMGGYAAILFATLLKLQGAIANVPQIDTETWAKYFFADSHVNFLDLTKLINNASYTPFISLHYGNFEADFVSAHKLINILKHKSTFFIHNKYQSDKHEFFITKHLIEAEINFMDNH